MGNNGAKRADINGKQTRKIKERRTNVNRIKKENIQLKLWEMINLRTTIIDKDKQTIMLNKKQEKNTTDKKMKKTTQIIKEKEIQEVRTDKKNNGNATTTTNHVNERTRGKRR